MPLDPFAARSSRCGGTTSPSSAIATALAQLSISALLVLLFVVPPSSSSAYVRVPSSHGRSRAPTGPRCLRRRRAARNSADVGPVGVLGSLGHDDERWDIRSNNAAGPDAGPQQRGGSKALPGRSRSRSSSGAPSSDRRRLLLLGASSAVVPSSLIASGAATAAPPATSTAPSSVQPAAVNAAQETTTETDTGGGDFRTGAYGREEYTNSIVASRDTNISPREVYDTIVSEYVRYPLEHMPERAGGGAAAAAAKPRALDVGAGAGVSTQVLWDLGYRSIDAVDWSSAAWDRYVADDPAGMCPPGVTFYGLDDERYLDEWRSRNLPKFDVIVFNFGINERKAVQFATELLRPGGHGRLLAPVNVQADYWLKQTYKVYDDSGSVVKVLGGDIGAWSVQFQPDVTQDTCQGVWCAPFNGFQRKR